MKLKNLKLVIVFFILLGLITPFIISNLTLKGPPLNFPEKSQIEVQDICGMCHMGSNDNESIEYNRMKELGVNWTRVDFSWISIETSPNIWYWDNWDAFLNATENHNRAVLGLLVYDNDNVETIISGFDRYIHPDDIPLFLNYVNKTVRRYVNQVGAWEIWNEPNIETFWDGPIEHFYTLFGQTQELIHDIELELGQDIIILSSAMAGAVAGFVPPNFDAMFEAGVMKYVDAIALHFYNYDADSLYQGIMQHISIGNKYGFNGEYWITEIGNPTGGQYPWRVTQEMLANNVLKSYVISAAYNIKRVFWYHDIDSTNPNLYDSEGWFGLLYGNGTWKPGAYAYALFSKYCSNKFYVPQLVSKVGFISTNDLVATLYRNQDGNSSLIMWYDPSLYERGEVIVCLELGNIVGNVYLHDIYTGEKEILVKNTVQVSDKPVLITYSVETFTDSIIIHIEDSIISILILNFILIPFFASMSIVLIKYRRFRKFTR